MEVVFVGISNKADKTGKDIQPFDPSTNSGKLIHDIDTRLIKPSIKTNLVPFTPVDEHNKIRYPNAQEIQDNLRACIELLISHSSCIAFLLGKLVQEAILKNVQHTKIKEGVYKIDDSEVYLVPAHHPSYITTYRRNQVNQYIDDIAQVISNLRG